MKLSPPGVTMTRSPSISVDSLYPHFGIAPPCSANQIDRPLNFAVIFVQCGNGTDVAQNEDLIAIDGGCAARSGAPTIVIVVAVACSRDFRFPNQLTALRVDADRIARFVPGSHRVDASFGNTHRRVTAAGVSESPLQRRATIGPLLEQCLRCRFAVAIGATPLRPIGVFCHRGGGEQDDAKERKRVNIHVSKERLGGKREGETVRQV